ncbi:MAG: stalk domain-containing protein [Bacillota bacterium]
MKKRLLCTFLLVFLLGTTVGASQTYSKTITAWFYNLQINMNGSPMTFTNQPFIYNDHIYVSLNDLSKNLGYTLNWDNDRKIMNITSSTADAVALSTLKYQLEQKNIEVNDLKFQLEQKELQLSMLKDNTSTSSSSSSDDLEDLEDLLADDYEKHYNNGRNLYFTYDVSQLSNDNIRVKMYGDFDRTSSYWTSRSNSTFKNFILDICEEIDKEFNEDVEIIVYDKDKDRTAEYIYDDSDNDLEEAYTYGSSSDDDDLDDMESTLEDDYDRHTNNGRTMEFTYSLRYLSNDDIEVEMDGDFSRSSSYWSSRNKSDFRDFILDICKEIDKDFNEDIKVIVYDSSNYRIAEYSYDDSDNDIDGDYDYEY